MSQSVFQVSGHYGQIGIEAEEADLPEWVTGDEVAVWTDTAIWVATRSDAEGPITVAVQLGIERVCPHRVVYDGRLMAASPRLLVGSALAGNTHAIDLPERGWFRLRVSVGPPPVAHVLVEIGPSE
jgi:hypothetical protein